LSAQAERSGTFELAGGVARVLAAELILLPTGLLTAAILTRSLGPERYGAFSLAASFIGWLTVTTTVLLARAAVKFISEAHDWRPVATEVLRWRLLIGVASAVLVIALADPIAGLLKRPELTPYLRLFAFDLVLANLARAYREVLTGTGRFRELALVSAMRWMSRLVLVAALVIMTGSVMFAVIGSLGATLAELAIARYFQHIPLRGRGAVTARAMWKVAAPLFVYGAASQLSSRVDLFALSALGGTTAETGYYAAAQNVAVAPGLFALAFAPLLHATLGRLRRNRDHDEARVVGRVALRTAIALLPFAALVAGASDEIVRVIFGADFTAAAPLLTLLFAAAVGTSVSSVAVAIIMAADRPAIVSMLGIGSLGAAIIGHLVLIPRLGALGAAIVTAVTGASGAALAIGIVHGVWRVHAYHTLFRAVVIAAPAYWAAAYIATPTLLGVVVKLTLLSLVVVGAFIALGELHADDKVRLRATFPTLFGPEKRVS
jgi:O-antigen/teichoic acid export membrane protein